MVPERLNERATPKPLEGDAVLTVGAGTAVWLLVGLVLIPFHHKLNQHGHLWWIAAAFTGAGLGLVGLLVVIRRDRRTGSGRRG